jgi:hypothetical protein
MTITNPNVFAVTVSSVQVSWNATTGASGGQGGNPLALQTIQLGTIIWTASSSTSPYTSTVTTGVTIPGNGAVTTIIFTFDHNYSNSSGNSITINLSTPGCEATPIHNP